MVNPKFQHHTPFVIPTKVTLELAERHCLIYLHHLQISLPLLPPLSNEHIALRRKLNTFKILMQKRVHITYTAIYPDFFVHPPLSTPSSQAYASWCGSDTSPFSVYLGEKNVKYSSQDPPSPQNIHVFGSITLTKLEDDNSWRYK